MVPGTRVAGGAGDARAACDASACGPVRRLLDPPFREFAGTPIRVEADQPDVAVHGLWLVCVCRVGGQALDDAGVTLEGEDLVLELPRPFRVAPVHPFSDDLGASLPGAAERPGRVRSIVHEELRDLVRVIALPSGAVAGQPVLEVRSVHLLPPPVRQYRTFPSI